jgi:hypothetical protein
LLCALVTMTTTSHFWMTTQMVTALVVTQQIEPWYLLWTQAGAAYFVARTTGMICKLIGYDDCKLEFILCV